MSTPRKHPETTTSAHHRRAHLDPTAKSEFSNVGRRASEASNGGHSPRAYLDTTANSVLPFVGWPNGELTADTREVSPRKHLDTTANSDLSPPGWVAHTHHSAPSVSTLSAARN